MFFDYINYKGYGISIFILVVVLKMRMIEQYLL